MQRVGQGANTVNMKLDNIADYTYFGGLFPIHTPVSIKY